MRERCKVGEFRGWRYGAVPAGVAAQLESWLERERVDGGLELKPGRVWRVGALAVKLSRPRRTADAWLRKSAAVRAADLHARIAPIRSPRPLVALDKRAGGKLVASLLVSEFIEGRRLPQVWSTDATARDAFPLFLAQMHRHGVFHGDLGVFNMLWDGRAWVLLDLDGLRGARHALRKTAVVVDQWARVLAVLDDPGSVRAAFEAYLQNAPRLAQPERVWARAQRLSRKYAADLVTKRARARPAERGA